MGCRCAERRKMIQRAARKKVGALTAAKFVAKTFAQDTAKWVRRSPGK